jgi:hypothetical protein
LLIAPILLGCLTGCGTMERMKCMIKESTQSIHCNRQAVERSTEVIRENGELIDQSTEVLKENRKGLEAMRG